MPIVRKLREGDRMLNEGTDPTEVLRHLEVSESSWARWRAQFGGMKADEAMRLVAERTSGTRSRWALMARRARRGVMMNPESTNRDQVTR